MNLAVALPVFARVCAEVHGKCRHDLCDVGGGCLQQRRGAGYGDGLRSRAHLELKIERELVAGPHGDAGAHELLETRAAAMVTV